MVNCPRVSAIQMVSTTDLDTNLKVAQQLIVQAVNAGSQMVLLPEYFAIMASQDKDKLQMMVKVKYSHFSLPWLNVFNCG